MSLQNTYEKLILNIRPLRVKYLIRRVIKIPKLPINQITPPIATKIVSNLFLCPSIREVLNEQTQSELAGQGITAVVLEEDTEQAIHKKTPYRAPNEGPNQPNHTTNRDKNSFKFISI